MKKSVSTVYGVLLVIGFILMALSFAFAGKKNTSFAEDSRRIELQPDRVVEVETAPKSGNAEVDALIREARGQLDQIAAANDAIADPALSRQIEDIEATCRQILQRSLQRVVKP